MRRVATALGRLLDVGRTKHHRCKHVTKRMRVEFDRHPVRTSRSTSAGQLAVVGELPMAERRGAAEMAGKFLREAGVLVATLGWLEKAIQGGMPSLGWTVSTVGAGLILALFGASLSDRGAELGRLQLPHRRGSYGPARVRLRLGRCA
jgi:hypothetical protein